MSARWAAAAMALVFAVQLGVPAAMIARRELTLRGGEAFRFRCAPVDPADPFRGRYVALDFDVERGEVPVEDELTAGQTVFASIESDGNGFARISGIGAGRPSDGAHVKGRVRSSTREHVRIDLPFDRYYLAEHKAPEAEAAYRDALRDDPDGSWAVVRVRDGYAVLEELYVGDVPVHDLFEAGGAPGSGR